MPAIQAMRSDALALRAKEDVQEKIPSFFNSVNKSLGQNIVQGQDSAQAVAEARFAAANQLAATLRQKIDGEGGLAELVAGAGMDLINSSISLLLSALGKTTTQDLLDTASAISAFLSEKEALQLQWDAAAATFAQWTVQAGYTGHGDLFPSTEETPADKDVEKTVTQWLRASGPDDPLKISLNADGTPDLSGMSFMGESLTQPPGLSLYEYEDTNAAGGKKTRNITVSFDRSGDNLFGAEDAGSISDTASQLLTDKAGNYWLRYDYVTTVTQTASPGTLIVDRISLPAGSIQSGVDYDTRYGDNPGNVALNTLPVNSDTNDFDREREFEATLSASSSGSSITVGNATGLYVGDLLEIPLASGGTDYRTITRISGNTLTLDSSLTSTASSGAVVTVSSYPNPDDFSPAVQTTLSADVSAPPTGALSVDYVENSNSIVVSNSGDFLVSDLVGVKLDSGDIEYRTVIDKTPPNTLILSGPFSGPVSAGANASTTGVTVADASELAVNDLVGITLASGVVEYRTITNKVGNRLILEAPLSEAADTGGNVTTVSGTDANSYPDTPRFYRADNMTVDGTLGTIEIPALKPVFEKSALGGRGATTYRDALTPRWTDRNYYVGVDGTTRNYDSYYSWGSVGSISRVGRY